MKFSAVFIVAVLLFAVFLVIKIDFVAYNDASSWYVSFFIM